MSEITTTTTRSWSERSRTGWPRRRPSICTPRCDESGATAGTSGCRQRNSRRERYRGIRPAFGYPACPDHSEKFKLFDLLEARSIGLDLTESAAMTPAASVSGLYFAHPMVRYFTVGRVGADQVQRYARRAGRQVSEVERWLGPSLAYETGEVSV